MIADSFHAEMMVAYVKQSRLSTEDESAIEEKLTIARAAGIPIEILEGEDAIDALLDFAKARGTTQLFVGHFKRSRNRLWGDPMNKLIRKSQGMDIRIFPQ
jgi:K+-sensing histidine kinase KdpD